MTNSCATWASSSSPGGPRPNARRGAGAENSRSLSNPPVRPPSGHADLMDVTETELLDAIRRLLDVPAADVVVGVGDDAAVLRSGSGDLVLTTDGLVQDRHFELGSIAPRDLGAKAIVVNVSDLAAMAASPRFALSALTVSDRVDAAWAMEVFGGMRDACDEYALRLVGGNLAMSSEVALIDRRDGRGGAGEGGDAQRGEPRRCIVVTGTLGGAAAGLRLGRRRGGWNRSSWPRSGRHVRPIARIGEAAVLARRGASAMIDLSDGLGMDLRTAVQGERGRGGPPGAGPAGRSGSHRRGGARGRRGLRAGGDASIARCRGHRRPPSSTTRSGCT